ncbi:maleate cis-trans isomerase family protein [Vreelandella nigrificans]|uniref:Arylmalonate decarboxylase n=1 Tax=Vreelandella nigrificans TaxID=2042704 RepID=A0A2A4HHT7_9GAMM|nr:arylmalonate decarboxylase [Halomonas nigrificans]PCF93919.1 arylmalonate decarboxylase [Halomonas nigrificans]
MNMLGHRLRVGVVIPSTNTSVQPEMDDLRPYGVTNHIGRMVIVDNNLTEECGFNSVIQAMRSATTPAIQSMKDCKLDRVIVAVSPDAYWRGRDMHLKMLSDLQETAGGIGITTSADAIGLALKKLGDVHRIGLISPYTTIGDEAVSQFFTDNGYEILALANLGGKSPSRISSVSQEDLRHAVEVANAPDVQAIVQVGTNVPMAAFAAAAEQWTGKPVIANNSVLYWHALRMSGIEDQFSGSGKLFSRY